MAFEIAALVPLFPLVARDTTRHYVRDKDQFDKRGMGLRLWTVLATLLLFVVIGYVLCLHSEPESRLILLFWPTGNFFLRAATVWLVPQPLLYIVALILLVLPPEKDRSWLNVELGLTIFAFILASWTICTSIAALILYVPTAVPLTPTFAGTLLVVIIAIAAWIMDIVLLVLVSLTRDRVAENTATVM